MTNESADEEATLPETVRQQIFSRAGKYSTVHAEAVSACIAKMQGKQVRSNKTKQQKMTQPHMAKISNWLVHNFLLLTSTTVLAQWQPLHHQRSTETAYFLDLRSVKQTGPMSIYRQVKVLSQGSEQQPQLLESSVSLHEYDCMSAKMRVLSVTRFSRPWGDGDKLEASQPPAGLHVWQALPQSPLGLQALDMLCPSGKDN